MLRKLSLICAVAAILFLPSTPTFAGRGHGGHGHGGHHGGHGHWHGGHGHWRGGHAHWRGGHWRGHGGGWWGPSVGIGIGGYYGRRCYDPYYGYYPCRYGWGY